jgi:hypothetical protein
MLKDRKDVQVVTFNVDDNVGLVAPFMKQNKYTFPVVPAADLVHEIVPTLGIPLNWIVDAAGVVRQEAVGFGGDEKWADQMVAALEKLKKGTT